MCPSPGIHREAEVGSPAFWFCCGAGVVLALQLVSVTLHARGDWTFLLHVAPDKPYQYLLERDLGTIRNKVPGGHDGEIFYAIARDPFDRRGTSSTMLQIEDAQYRYRRILYPLLAGGAGLFDPWTTLFGSIVLTWVGAGLAAAAVADLCRQWGLARWTVLLALLNPGVLIGSVTLCSDALALGLAMLALVCTVRQRYFAAIVSSSLLLLTKETYVLFPWALAVYLWMEQRRRVALCFAVVPLLPVAAWSLWLWNALPRGPVPTHNFTFPGQGMLESIPAWFDSQLSTNTGDIVLGLMGILLLLGAIVLLFVSRNRLLLYTSLAWCALAVVLSIDVWGRSNNALRVLAPLWTLASLNLSWVLSRQDSALPLEHPRAPPSPTEVIGA